MIYRVIHQLVAIPSAPYLQPTGVRTRGNDEHFRTIDYVHVREGRLVYLQKITGAG
jgi:hypothetical protein